MSTDPNSAGGTNAAGAPPATRTLELGGTTVRVERPSALKASRALAGIRALSRAAPELGSDLAVFRRKYEAENVLELDRVQAKLRNPPRPLTDPDGTVRLDPDTGQPLLLPSPVDRLTEADWEAAGGTWRIAVSPSGPEIVLALLDRGLELAELHVYRLLSLFTIPNADLKRYRAEGSLEDRLDARAAELLDDAYADELLELAVVVAETVDGHFRRKVGDLGDRMGNALRLFGIDPSRLRAPDTTTPTPAPPTAPPSNDGPSDTRPSSSTVSPAPTPDGPLTSSSDSPMTSSWSSADYSTPTPNAESSPSTTPEPEPEPAPAG